jgi:DNA-binding MarR family transcriptional regulator
MMYDMSTDGYPGPTEPMIGALLRRASEATHRELFARLQAAGFGDLRWAHFSLFAFPGLHGLRPTELADRVRMSKQALNALLNDLDDFGYVVRRPAHGDGRYRVLELTPRGVELAAAIKRILQDIEADIAERIGQRQLDRLKAATATIAQLYPDPTPDHQDPSVRPAGAT